ncbi:MAG: DUF3857 domain-containing protein [Saprospiraceae bacterium]
MIRYYFFLFALLASTTLFAQKAPMKYGKVPAEDIALQVYAPDSSANAVILGDYGDLKFDIGPDGLMYRFKRHKRIKIFKRAGFDEGDITIPYHNRSHDLGRVKAQVISPTGVVTEISRKDMFDEKVVGNWMQKKFSVPNLEEGSIIELEYDIVSGNLFHLRDWYFQHAIPTRFSEFRVEMPDWLDYIYLFQGTDKLTTNENDSGITNIRGTTFETNRNRYVAENVPALKAESYITTMDDYRMRIKFQLRSVNIPGSYMETFMTSWKELADDLLEDEDFGLQVTKPRYYKNLLAAVTPTLTNTTDQAKRANDIYEFLTENMEWNDRTGIYAMKKLDDAFEERKGNAATINLMMIALLRENGITAHPVLISTRSHGKMFEIYPMISQFNHTMVYAELDGTPTLMDVSSPLRPMGTPRVSSLNRRGWVVVEDSPQWVSINSPNSSDVMMANLQLDEEGTLIGDIKCSHNGYSAISERAQQKDDEEGAYWQERLTEQFADVEVSNIEFENAQAIRKSFKDKMEVTIENAAQVNGNFIYVSPTIYSNFLENPFELAERSYPVDMAYPFKEHTITNIKLPSGYAVEELPEEVKMALPNNGGKFEYRIDVRDDLVQVIKKVSVDQTYFTPEEYQGLKNFFDLVIEKQGEQIVLKKSM